MDKIIDLPVPGLMANTYIWNYVNDLLEAGELCETGVQVLKISYEEFRSTIICQDMVAEILADIKGAHLDDLARKNNHALKVCFQDTIFMTRFRFSLYSQYHKAKVKNMAQLVRVHEMITAILIAESKKAV